MVREFQKFSKKKNWNEPLPTCTTQFKPNRHFWLTNRFFMVEQVFFIYFRTKPNQMVRSYPWPNKVMTTTQVHIFGSMFHVPTKKKLPNATNVKITHRETIVPNFVIILIARLRTGCHLTLSHLGLIVKI